MRNRLITQSNEQCVVFTDITLNSGKYGNSHILDEFANRYNCLYEFSSDTLSKSSDKINFHKCKPKSRDSISTYTIGSALPIVYKINGEKSRSYKIEKTKSQFTKDDELFVKYLWDFPGINLGKLHKKLRKYEPNSKHTSCIEIDALLKRATKDELKEVLRPSEYIQIQHYALDKLPPKIPNPYQFLIPKEN